MGIFLILLSLLSAQALAQDGVFEINQLCVDTGCFTGDSPGFPVEITTSGNYRLTSDITVNSALTTAIEVSEVNNLTLDLNGFGMSGITECSGGIVTCTDTGSGDGISLSKSSKVVIKNGSIVGFGDHGIVGNVFNEFMIKNLIMTDNGSHAIDVLSGATLINNEIYTNGGNGFNASTNLSSSVIIGNSFINNGGTAINMGSCGNNIIEFNDTGDENCSSDRSNNICKNIHCVIN